MAPRFFSLFIILLASVQLQSQNLVPNHSFEEFDDGCPANLNETPLGWNWWTESPNSFNTCVEPQNLTDSLGGIPWNGFGYQWPADGECYAGLAVFAPNVSGQNFREYLGCELNGILDVGETYYVSFKTSMAFGNYFYPTCASNRIGVYFTTQGYDSDNNPLEIPNESHVYEPNLIADTTNWTVVQGTFVADQAYSHMGMGVFFEYDQLETHNMGSMDICLSYYYIDDVCVSRFPDCLVSTSNNARGELDMKIYPNPAKDVVFIESRSVLKSFQLVDITGSIVLYNAATNQNKSRIELSEYPAGIYFVIAESNRGIKREKLTVVR